ncbi:MAG: GHMP kinase [Deltaproteobacteria bacterium]|nr:GHMP kinase [Deltaproteobacteria bacterium]
MIISKTPLRMSFAGGGSDFADYYRQKSGCVIGTTINKYVYIAVNKRFTDHIRVGYSKSEYVMNVEDIEHNLVREALKLVGVTKGIEVVYMSDMLPAHEGSGLGASSAILVGTLHALHAYKGEFVSAETLAREACQIEIDILGHPIGKQDQYAAAFGGMNYFQFNADETVLVEPVIFKREVKEELNKNLLLFYTGINSRSDVVLVEQKENIEKNRLILDKMVALTHDLKRFLIEGDLRTFGEILHTGWELKQKLATKVTNPIIDSYYAAAKEAGAIGGKILGSGGGGFLLLYCEPKNQERVRAALSTLKETPFSFESEGSRIIYVH